jgi:hypothetical protein
VKRKYALPPPASWRLVAALSTTGTTCNGKPVVVDVVKIAR